MVNSSRVLFCHKPFSKRGKRLKWGCLVRIKERTWLTGPGPNISVNTNDHWQVAFQIILLLTWHSFGDCIHQVSLCYFRLLIRLLHLPLEYIQSSFCVSLRFACKLFWLCIKLSTLVWTVHLLRVFPRQNIFRCFSRYETQHSNGGLIFLHLCHWDILRYMHGCGLRLLHSLPPTLYQQECFAINLVQRWCAMICNCAIDNEKFNFRRAVRF